MYDSVFLCSIRLSVPREIRSVRTSFQVLLPIESCTYLPSLMRMAEHLPFAMWLTAVSRPEVLVELGTFRRTSNCGFCQAIAALGLSTHAFAVD